MSDLPRASGSAYGNPQPYPTVDLERHSLEGRLNVARQLAAAFRKAGDQRRAKTWLDTCDELLDHLAHVEERAASAALGRAAGGAA